MHPLRVMAVMLCVAAWLVQAAVPALAEEADPFNDIAGDLEAEGGYRHSVEARGGKIPVILAGITTIDPPFDLADRAGATFIDLTQARGLPQIELELLRHAYELLMGG